MTKKRLFSAVWINGRQLQGLECDLNSEICGTCSQASGSSVWASPHKGPGKYDDTQAGQGVVCAPIGTRKPWWGTRVGRKHCMEAGAGAGETSKGQGVE